MIDIRKIAKTDPADDFREPLPDQQEEKTRYIHLEREQVIADKEQERVIDRMEASAKSQLLRAEINKGVNRGEEPLTLLLQAIECIGLMAGDSVFATQNTRILCERYSKTIEKQP